MPDNLLKNLTKGLAEPILTNHQHKEYGSRHWNRHFAAEELVLIVVPQNGCWVYCTICGGWRGCRSGRVADGVNQINH